jgi:hypothetical protein
MRSKKEIENEIVSLKKQIEAFGPKSAVDPNKLLQESTKEDTSSQLFTLLKYMIDESRRTTTILRGMSDTITRLEEDLVYYQEEAQERAIAPGADQSSGQFSAKKEVPLSEIDAKLVQNIQLSRSSMACADDLRSRMNYRGRNAVSARLNRLYRMGVLERYQLGKKVYYKYDAAKTNGMLIVSPIQ